MTREEANVIAEDLTARCGYAHCVLRPGPGREGWTVQNLRTTEDRLYCGELAFSEIEFTYLPVQSKAAVG